MAWSLHGLSLWVAVAASVPAMDSLLNLKNETSEFQFGTPLYVKLFKERKSAKRLYKPVPVSDTKT
jgi:hypothetical protein